MTSASTKRRSSISALHLATHERQRSEIQRLRAAMVHAMDEAAIGADDSMRSPSGMQYVLRRISKDLKTALEKK